MSQPRTLVQCPTCGRRITDTGTTYHGAGGRYRRPCRHQLDGATCPGGLIRVEP